MAMTGSCLCGSVRLAAAGEPFFVGKCYCADCRKESGGGHATVVVVADAGLTVAGETRAYAKSADSGARVVRHFCPTCGTTLFVRSESVPGASAIRAGVLDGSPPLTLEAAIYCARAPAWDRPPADLPQFPELPPRG